MRMWKHGKNTGHSQNIGSKKGKKVRHFAIPLFLLLFGMLIFCYSGWSLFKQTYLIGRLAFSKPKVTFTERKFLINDVYMYRPKIGSEIGTIVIPSINLQYPIIHGDDDDSLGKGVGHDPGTTLPGEKGNVVLAGHRDTVFRNLGKVKIGDLITLKTYYGDFTYKVSKIRIVDGEDRTVIVRKDYEMLTIYTCYPFEYIGSAPQRYVLDCDFLEGNKTKELKVEEGGKK